MALLQVPAAVFRIAFNLALGDHVAAIRVGQIAFACR